MLNIFSPYVLYNLLANTCRSASTSKVPHAYVWHTKCTRDVSTAYVLRSILICGVSVLYQLLFNTFENKRLCSLCSCNSHIIVINYQRSKMPPEKSRLSRLTPKKKKKKKKKKKQGGKGDISKLPILVVRRHEQRQRLYQA